MRGAVFDAWSSGDLAQMLSVIDVQPARLIDRHFLLQSIVAETYKRRADPVMREVCRRIARRHLAEFPKLKGPLKRSLDGYMPSVSTFRHLAMVFTEDGEYDEAIRVGELAVSYGVYDESFIDEIKRRIARFQKRKKRRL